MSDEPGVWFLAATLAVAGIVLIILGRKQRAGNLRRNWLAGLRTWETMASDDAWHAAHAATSGWITAAGVVQVLAAAILVVLMPDEPLLPVLVLGAAVVTLALVVTAGIRGHRIAARVNRHPPAG